MTADPSIAFEVKALQDKTPQGNEPVLGGQLRQKAVWVDESVCIGCTYCTCVATNTFSIEQENGRARAFRQDGDSTELIQEAIDTCPVNCIDWVKFEEIADLRLALKEKSIRPLGLPPLR